MFNKIAHYLSRFTGIFDFAENSELQNRKNFFLAWFLICSAATLLFFIILDVSLGFWQFVPSHLVRFAVVLSSLALLAKNKHIESLYLLVALFVPTVVYNILSQPRVSLDSILLFPLCTGLFVLSKNRVLNYSFLLFCILISYWSLYYQAGNKELVIGAGEFFAIATYFIVFFASLSFFVFEFRYLGKELSERNGQLLAAVKELNLHNAKLENSNKLIMQIMSVIGHDLRNSFNSISGYSSLLRDNWPNYSPQKRTDFLVQLAESSSCGHQTLENLLELARVNSGSIVPIRKSVDIVGLCSSIVTEMQGLGAHKRLPMLVETADFITCSTDAHLASVIIRNLLANAIKYAKEGTPVSVFVAKKIEFAEVSIRNYGSKLPEEVRAAFNTEQKSSSNIDWSDKTAGLGLIVCSEFTEKLGGRIEIDPSYKFVEFKLLLPLI
jgi:signal transduction histidine kinase